MKNNLVAILLQINFIASFFSLKISNNPAALYMRWLMFSFQRCLLNIVMILLQMQFLRTLNSFCSCETACFMLKLVMMKGTHFSSCIGKLTLEKKWARFAKDDFDSSIHISFFLFKGGY